MACRNPCRSNTVTNNYVVFVLAWLRTHRDIPYFFSLALVKNGMTANVVFEDAVHSLTIKEIRDALPPDTFTSGEKRSRSKLEEAASTLPQDHRSVLVDAARVKRRRLEQPDHEVAVERDETVQPLSDPFFSKLSLMNVAKNVHPNSSTRQARTHFVQPHVPFAPELSSPVRFRSCLSLICRTRTNCHLLNPILLTF